MNRTDRLFAMLLLLQSRRVITAAQIASHFEVTERTVYRDLAALGEAGVPLVGEAGVGYKLMRGYQLPPLMFSPEEAFALITGGHLAEGLTDHRMRASIRSALDKITTVLPASLQDRVGRLAKSISIKSMKRGVPAVSLGAIQMMVAEGRVLRLRYHAASRSEPSVRAVEPLSVVFYLDHWHLLAWCRLRKDIRDFRIDRITACEALPEVAPTKPPFDLADHIAKRMAEGEGEVVVVSIAKEAEESLRRHWGAAILEERAQGDKIEMKLACRYDGQAHIAQWLLGFGTLVQIIEPHALRVKAVEMAMATARHHEARKNKVS